VGDGALGLDQLDLRAGHRPPAREHPALDHGAGRQDDLDSLEVLAADHLQAAHIHRLPPRGLGIEIEGAGRHVLDPEGAVFAGGRLLHAGGGEHDEAGAHGGRTRRVEEDLGAGHGLAVRIDRPALHGRGGLEHDAQRLFRRHQDAGSAAGRVAGALDVHIDGLARAPVLDPEKAVLPGDGGGRAVRSAEAGERVVGRRGDGDPGAFDRLAAGAGDEALQGHAADERDRPQVDGAAAFRHGQARDGDGRVAGATGGEAEAAGREVRDLEPAVGAGHGLEAVGVVAVPTHPDHHVAGGIGLQHDGGAGHRLLIGLVHDAADAGPALAENEAHRGGRTAGLERRQGLAGRGEAAPGERQLVREAGEEGGDAEGAGRGGERVAAAAPASRAPRPAARLQTGLDRDARHRLPLLVHDGAGDRLCRLQGEGRSSTVFGLYSPIGLLPEEAGGGPVQLQHPAGHRVELVGAIGAHAPERAPVVGPDEGSGYRPAIRRGDDPPVQGPRRGQSQLLRTLVGLKRRFERWFEIAVEDAVSCDDGELDLVPAGERDREEPVLGGRADGPEGLADPHDGARHGLAGGIHDPDIPASARGQMEGQRGGPHVPALGEREPRHPGADQQALFRTTEQDEQALRIGQPRLDRRPPVGPPLRIRRAHPRPGQRPAVRAGHADLRFEILLQSDRRQVEGLDQGGQPVLLWHVPRGLDHHPPHARLGRLEVKSAVRVHRYGRGRPGSGLPFQIEAAELGGWRDRDQQHPGILGDRTLDLAANCDVRGGRGQEQQQRSQEVVHGASKGHKGSRTQRTAKTARVLLVVPAVPAVPWVLFLVLLQLHHRLAARGHRGRAAPRAAVGRGDREAPVSDRDALELP
jgi:hypothetical protein